MEGKFIVIEGLDGSGKTTQIRLLSARLKAMGRSVMNKPTWKGGIISGLLGLLPFYLLLCLFGFMGIEREEEF